MTKSDACAKHDGIRVTIDPRKRTHNKVYHVPCSRCGEEIETHIYSSDKVYLCKYCRAMQGKRLKVAEQDFLDTVMTRGEQRYVKAVEKMRKQIPSFDEKYAKAIEVAKQRTECYGSIPEAMVAIELIHLGHSIIPQQKIGKYHADFVLPKVKLIVEVDGTLYHQNDNLDRDASMILALGSDWDIIHIPAEYISKDIRKLKVLLNAKLQQQGKI